MNGRVWLTALPIFFFFFHVGNNGLINYCFYISILSNFSFEKFLKISFASKKFYYRREILDSPVIQHLVREDSALRLFATWFEMGNLFTFVLLCSSILQITAVLILNLLFNIWVDEWAVSYRAALAVFQIGKFFDLSIHGNSRRYFL